MKIEMNITEQEDESRTDILIEEREMITDTRRQLERTMKTPEYVRTGFIAEKELNQANPFEPRVNLNRSPVMMKSNTELQEKMAEERTTHIQTNPEETPEDKGEWITLQIGDNIMLQREAVIRMERHIYDARAALNAIYKSAITTKNVSRLVKEKSGEALKHLGALQKDMGYIKKGGKLNIETDSNEGSRMLQNSIETKTMERSTQTTENKNGDEYRKSADGDADRNSKEESGKRKEISPNFQEDEKER